MDISEAIRLSLKNIAKHGDTDIFPFPIERNLFFDRPDECRNLLLEVHKHFDRHLATYPPVTIESLTQVGYTGFRWATQIEPFWNAYYLALVVAIADQIESIRIPKEEGIVFSYRFGWNEDEAKLFENVTWRDYRRRAIELSREAEFVVLTDVSNFYHSIYHHNIDNALTRLPDPDDYPHRLKRLLFHFSKNVSYGLPIGGPASRILAELSLDSVDQNLFRRRIRYCRYADDLTLFCASKSEAYEILVFLSEKLFNEGLVLQKYKTRILSADEFRETSAFLDPKDGGADVVEATDEQKLLHISIRFDPYSPNAEEEYEALKAAVRQVDIVGILGREVAKAAIDPTVTRQAINAIRALDEFGRDGAIRTLLDPTNLNVLLPVFSTVMRAVRGLYEELPASTKGFVDQSLVNIYEKGSHLLSVDLNLSYFLQALAVAQNARKEEILIEVYDNKPSPLLRRQIILAMARWKRFYWLKDVKNKYSGLSEWEKRAFLIASYVLRDEGHHWRLNTKHTWSPMDTLVRDWFSQKYQETENIPA
jgi:Reverse transcriptase (RNA-dependent DNA polymerase)